MPLQSTSGTASYDAFGGGVAAVPKYIEDYFSTYLVTGDGTAPAVNNGIDLSTKGGLVWTKKRSAAGSHSLFDTARGANLRLISNDTAAQDSVNLSFTTTGFSNYTFDSGVTYTSWSWAKAPKFFDVVTYTGNGVNGRAISHNLGAVPGCMIIKKTSAAEQWAVYHRSTGNTQYGMLDQTNAFDTFSGAWNNTTPTDTVFTVGNWAKVNESGQTYVAYLFAHNAGGFGLTGTDNVISCGSFTTGSGGKISAPVNLGYEAQWLLAKNVNSAENWVMYDIMRGMNNTGYAALNPNSSGAEYTGTSAISPTATGFDTPNASGPFASSATYIYIAIRRGPMKVPTSGTSVYNGITRTGTTGAVTVTGVGFTPDMGVGFGRSASIGTAWYDRLRGKELALRSALTNAEYSSAPGGEGTMTTTMDGMIVELTYGILNSTSVPYINWFFKRAPSFFDEVCYTGTGSNITLNHNLGAVPELMIFKTRTGAARAWGVYSSTLGVNKKLILNTTAAVVNDSFFVDTTPTATVFYPGNADESNEGGNTYVAYLFATCAGVSKVTSFTGNGSSQTINCGFTGGARLVLIKRTDSTGNWVTFDTARGISSGNDPALYLNSTAAEVTGVDAIDPDSTGFIVNQESTFNLNVSSATYIVLAVA